jgi:hypothetical protein
MPILSGPWAPAPTCLTWAVDAPGFEMPPVTAVSPWAMAATAVTR